jgi:hypothetical protein
MFDNFCSLFSNAAQPGHYAYEAFNKVPQLSLLIQAGYMLGNMKNNNMNTNIGNIKNVANMASNVFSINPMNLINNKNPNISGLSGIISQFINNTPQESVKANDSNL